MIADIIAFLSANLQCKNTESKQKLNENLEIVSFSFMKEIIMFMEYFLLHTLLINIKAKIGESLKSLYIAFPKFYYSIYFKV